jgi:putative glutamine amidotransferase
MADKKEAMRARIGIPYRTQKEELSGERAKYEFYVRSVEKAGGAPVEVSLGLALPELRKLARSLDAIVLPGSPADVNPQRYGATRNAKTADADAAREKTDCELLEHCLEEGKPVLAICYGVQILNVYLGGSLVQDIGSEWLRSLPHSWERREQGAPEPFHSIEMVSGSKAIAAAGKAEAEVNSSHHQAVREPGKNLRITARAADGIVEAVEWEGDANWVVGVQWHPERMTGDTFSENLFRGLMNAARGSGVRA